MRKYSLSALFMSLFLLTLPFSTQADDTLPYCDEWSVGSGKFRVGADWLYWQVTQDNMEVIPMIKTTSSGFKHFRHIRPRQRWDSGYRVNVGYEFCDCWDIALYYTDLPTRNRSRHHHEGDDHCFGDLDDQFDFAKQINFNPKHLETMHLRFRNDLSWLDLDMSRSICFGECFTMRPHVGFRALWIDRRFHMHGLFNDEKFNEQFDSAGKKREPLFGAVFKDDLTGYGAEGGLWTNYELGCGLSVVGHVGGSILYSKHRTHQHSADFFSDEDEKEKKTETANVATANNATDNAETANEEKEHKHVHKMKPTNPVLFRDSRYFGVPTFDYFIGLQYDSTFCDFVLSGRVGWEQRVFFDVNRMSRHRGNLSAQGLTLHFEAIF